MQNLTRSARRRRAFLRINIALSVCALGFVSLTIASKAKEALAYGPEDGVCANIIGSANCLAGSTFAGSLPYTWTTCRQSSAWYEYGTLFPLPPLGPYYNCCVYEEQTIVCLSNGGYSYQYVSYFQSKTNGDASCIRQSNGNSTCLSD